MPVEECHSPSSWLWRLWHVSGIYRIVLAVHIQSNGVVHTRLRCISMSTFSCCCCKGCMPEGENCLVADVLTPMDAGSREGDGDEDRDGECDDDFRDVFDILSSSAARPSSSLSLVVVLVLPCLLCLWERLWTPWNCWSTSASVLQDGFHMSGVSPSFFHSLRWSRSWNTCPTWTFDESTHWKPSG